MNNGIKHQAMQSSIVMWNQIANQPQAKVLLAKSENGKRMIGNLLLGAKNAAERNDGFAVASFAGLIVKFAEDIGMTQILRPATILVLNAERGDVSVVHKSIAIISEVLEKQSQTIPCQESDHEIFAA